MSLPLSTHQRILASAGSGKTYQLIGRYLTLLLRGVSPSTILASTFTRQAAAQILARLLTRLADAAESPASLRQLREQAALPRLTAEDVRQTLYDLCRTMHRLRVRTLDSLLAAVVSSFPLELGLSPGVRVLDETEDRLLRDEALHRLLDETQTQRLVDLLRQLTEGDAGRPVVSSIDAAVRQCYDLWTHSTPGAWEVVERREGVGEEDRLELACRLAAIAPSIAHKSVQKRVADDALAAMRGDWEAFLESGLAQAVHCGGTYYKSPPSPELKAIYAPLVRHAIAVGANQLRARSLAARDLMESYHQHYAELKRQAAAVSFQDLSTLLVRAGATLPLDEIYFRLDGSIQHILLDEFQDTSIPQWRSIEPIVREIVSYAPPERSLFVVGDLKQSIYEWRAGEPHVLDQLPAILGGAHGGDLIEDVQLSRSYRSDPGVIDFVNTLFDGLAHNAALDEHAETAAQWASWFHTHEPTPTPRSQGYAEIRAVPKGDDRKACRRNRLIAAADLAAHLYRQAPSISIGVLFRSNDAVAEFMNEISSRGVPSSAVGGGFLTDSALVNIILDALRLADHPGDTIAAFNVAASPLGVSLGLDTAGAFPNALPTRLAVARSIRRDVLNRGLADVVSAWTKLIAPHGDLRDQRRLEQLTELAIEFDRSPSIRLSGFVSMVSTRRMHQAASAGIQAMTVHQAKGLEFDAVILPQLDSPLKGRISLVHDREDPLGDITSIAWGGREELRTCIPELASLYDATTHRIVRENLCVLYVAVTRAASALYMLVDRCEKEARLSCTFEGVIRAAVGALAADEEVLHTCGDPMWFNAFATAGRADEGAAERAGGRAFRVPKSPATRSAAPSPSAGADSPSRYLRLEHAAASRDARDVGIAMHLLLQRIEWLDDFRLDSSELQSLLRAHLPRETDRWRRNRLDEFSRLLDHPDIRRLLTRPSKEWHVARERPFARIADGRLISGVIDRLAWRVHNRAPVEAQIIDFKTDAIRPGDEPAAAEAHRPQLEAYRAAAAELLHLPASAVSLHIIFLATGASVPLE